MAAMVTTAIRERLRDDIQLWQADGLISEPTAALLRLRYEHRALGVAGVIKYLGLVGGLLAFFGLLGLIGAMADSEIFAALLVLATGAGLFYLGLRLSLDPRNHYAVSSKAVLALGSVALASGPGITAHAAHVSEGHIVFVVGLLWLPLVFVLAYRCKNAFLLILGVLALFHWVGSWNSMLGRSTYAFEIQDPRVMAAVALAAFAVGIHHERRLQERTLRFFRVYEALGLLYLDMSLLILSLEGWHGRGLSYALLLTLAALAQIVAGARLKNGLVIGFGVTFLSIDLYTRYYEQFWDRLDRGLFFLIGGALLFGAGAACERLLPRTTP